MAGACCASLISVTNPRSSELRWAVLHFNRTEHHEPLQYTADSKTKRTVGILTAERPDALTHEGAPGFTHDARGELFLSAVSSFTSNSFYENETARSDRQRTLLEVALKHPEWLLSFLRWLRHDAGIRTNALTLAADAVWLRLQAKVTEPEGINRKLISAVLARMDEPGRCWRTDLDLRQGDPQARQARCRRRGR